MYKLRELERKDLCVINSWRNNPKLIDFLGAPFRFINIEVDEQWFENYMNNRHSNVRCSIVDDNDTIIGLVSLTDIDLLNQTAVFHIMIGDEKNHNQGIGSFAVNEMVNHAFNNLNLRRIELLVLADNIKAQHVYEKNGFVFEGTKRRAVYKNGEFVDIKLYAIIKDFFSQNT